jgi:hypothetical protein
MSAESGSFGEMEGNLTRSDPNGPFALDDGTAERLLRGLMSFDDAPRRYRGVAAVMTALAAPPTGRELSGEREAVQAISRGVSVDATWPSRSLTFDASPSPRVRKTTTTMKRKVRLVGAALVGSAFLLSGLGAAGALPGEAQTIASEVWSSVGVSVPNPNAHSDQPGNSGTDVGTSGATHSTDTGATISENAKDSSNTGVNHGADVSSSASNGQSNAGTNTPGSASTHGSSSATRPPHPSQPTTGNNGNSGNSGNSGTHTATTDKNSDTKSTGGSGNATDGSPPTSRDAARQPHPV